MELTAIVDTLLNKSKEFGDIAQNVNESSKMRKEHALNAAQSIVKSIEVGIELLERVEDISQKNLDMQKQYDNVLNSLKKIIGDFDQQHNILEQIKNSEELKAANLPTVEELRVKYLKTLNQGTPVIREINDLIKEMLSLDEQIIQRKKSQKERTEKLKESNATIQEDADRAIAGSSSNLERGLELEKNFKTVEKLIEGKDIAELNKLKEEAKIGWELAVTVNKSSKSQWEFAEQVNLFTKELNDESISIKELVIEKSKVFGKTVALIAEISVLVCCELAEYIKDIEDQDLKGKADGVSGGDLEQFNNLIASIDSSCTEISMISTMNYDMAENIGLNASLEHKAVEIAKIETEHYATIKDEVERMTEATHYPVEGSGKNIDNGQILEKNVLELINQIENAG